MLHDAKAIANKFLEFAFEEGRCLDPMQILKLVYIAHGWCLAIADRPLIRDRIEAWQYGPVIPELYHSLKKYGRACVTEYLEDFDFESLEFEPVRENLSEEDEQIIEAVWKAYGRFKAFELSGMTHKPGTPWDQVYNHQAGQQNAPIPNELIRKHFIGLANRNAA
jgi:uncharacterized phage-associated protein